MPLPPPHRTAAVLLCLAATACGRVADVGRAPALTPITLSEEHHAMMSPGLPFALAEPPQPAAVQPASLWTGGRDSLLGERRAMQRGDILTVVIDINDRARIDNATSRQRQGRESMAIGSLFGLPERSATDLDPAVDLRATGSFAGDGSVRRSEQLTLRIAATVIAVLPNGVLQIEGRQEVRVNNELRELLVSGFVRPGDISRQNEITYDKIASARISYGGRGQITDVQQPRYGQQLADIVLPF
jgi:flagellar L-ring protein precursor FlgH